jgi:hypothetical protein
MFKLYRTIRFCLWRWVVRDRGPICSLLVIVVRLCLNTIEPFNLKFKSNIICKLHCQSVRAAVPACWQRHRAWCSAILSNLAAAILIRTSKCTSKLCFGIDPVLLLPYLCVRVCQTGWNHSLSSSKSTTCRLNCQSVRAAVPACWQRRRT